MTQSHYSLRWNNHQNHILAAFDALLQAETLVDVTLVCAETSVRAHKVVLSACSPFFQRIFSENPCKHPVIVLKDFSGWEVQAIVDFMYKGEISVVQEQLQSLIKAAESLQVRGLANQDPFDKDSILNQTPTPSTSPNDFERGFFGARRTPGEPASPFSPGSGYEPPVKLPHMSRLSFPEALLPRPECQSPIPRRKQARPRRRSGEMCTPQDLSKPSPPPPPPQVQPPPPPQSEDSSNMPENLCMKKPKEAPSPPPQLPPPQQQQQQQSQPDKEEMRQELSPAPSHSPELDLSLPMRDFRASPPASLPPTLNMKQEIDSHSPLPFPPMPSVSALAMTPPHSKFFGLDSPLGLFPPGLDGCRNPLFDMTDPRTTPDSQLFVKKKMGRPKGQHSAPRGGPPRSWTNAELTEALQHVWNKKMTTSQASRIFGIPYNSLLMYVRGKYGKSLKLEQLRKDCIGGPAGPIDLLNIGGSASSGNNNNNKGDAETPNTRPPSTEEPLPPHQPPPVFNPFAHSFYPDFGTGFPIPVSMIHLLPQSEKYGLPPPLPTSDDDTSCNNKSSSGSERGLKKEMDEEDLFRPPSLADDRRELVQQNGQD